MDDQVHKPFAEWLVGRSVKEQNPRQRGPCERVDREGEVGVTANLHAALSALERFTSPDLVPDDLLAKLFARLLD